MDITNELSVNTTIEKIVESEKQIDIVVNASGIGILKNVENLTLTEFTQTLNTNLIGGFLLMKAILPSMKLAKKGAYHQYSRSIR